MNKIFTVLGVLFILLLPTQAIEYNLIEEKEYPKTEKVLPFDKINTKNVVKGTISQDVEMTLALCIQLALGNNPQINSAFHDILASSARIRQVWSNFFPILSWQSGYTRLRQLQLSDALSANLEYNYFLLGQISLQQMLYDFGVTQNQATIRKLDYEGYKKTFEATVNDIIYQTKNAYYDVLLAYANKDVTQDTVDKYSQIYEQAKYIYKVGQSPKVDVTIAQTNLSNAKLELIKAQDNINLAIAKLNQVMGLPYLENYVIKDRLKYNPVNIKFEEALNIAKESRPELKLALIKVEGLRQTIKLTQKSFFPTVSVEAQYQRGGARFNSNYGYNLGGYLTFPNMNFMLIKNEISEAKFLYDRELANAINTQNNIYYEIQSAYLNLVDTKNQIPVATVNMKQAKENFELSYGRYKVGEATPIELKDSQNTYYNAQLTYYKAIYTYNRAKAQLEKAIGKNLI